MRGKLFSAALYRDALKRMKIAAIIYFALMILTQVIIPVLAAIESMGYEGVSPYLTGPEEVLGALPLMSYVMAPVLAFIAFYPFNRRNSSDFYHSLGYTRVCIYLSWLAAVVSIITASLILMSALSYLARLPFFELYTLSATGLADYLFTIFAASMFAVACVVLAMSFTGTWLSNIVAALIILLLPRVLMFMIRSMIADAVPTLTSHFLPLFTVNYNVFTGPLYLLINGFFYAGTSFDAFFNNIGADIFTTVIALIYMALGLVLYCIRKSETAENSAEGRSVQAVIRVAGTFAISLFGTWLIVTEDSAIEAAVIIYIIALIAFFAYEIITTRRWKNLVKALPSLLIVVALNVALILAVFISKNIILNRYAPADEIEWIQLSDDYRNIDYDNYFENLGNKVEIRDEEAFSMVSQILEESNNAIKNGTFNNMRYGISYPYESNGYRTSKTVAIHTNGQTIWRTLPLTAPQFERLMKSEISQEYKDKFMKLPEPAKDTLTVIIGPYSSMILNSAELSAISDTAAEEGNPSGVRIFGGIDAVMMNIYDTLQDEINRLGFEEWYRYMQFYSDMEHGNVIYSLIYSVDVAGRTQVRVPIAADALPETFEAILDKAVALTDRDQLETFLQLAGLDGEEPQANPFYDMQMYLCMPDEQGRMNIVGELSGSGYDYVNYNNTRTEKMLAILNNCMESNNKPNMDGYISLNYNYYGADTNGSGGHYLLPLPDDITLLKEFDVY